MNSIRTRTILPQSDNKCLLEEQIIIFGQNTLTMLTNMDTWYDDGKFKSPSKLNKEK